MSQQFQKILCPIDFDDACRSALDLARRVVEQTGARVCVLHVVSVEAEDDHSWQKGGTIQLENFVREQLYGKVDYEFVVRTGSVAAEVLDAAVGSQFEIRCAWHLDSVVRSYSHAGFTRRCDVRPQWELV